MSAWNRHEISAEALFNYMEWDVKFYGPVGIGYAKNVEELAQHVFKPIKDALPNYRVEPSFEAIAEGKFGGVHG